MPSKKIVITLPDDKVQSSILSGLNKRLGMLEDMVKDSKKKKRNSEIADLKKQIKQATSVKKSLGEKEIGGVKKTVNNLVDALSGLGRMRIPSPS